MKASFLRFIPVALIAFGCSDDDPILNDKYHVSGTITDAQTHQPLAGVQVQLLEDREPFISGGTVLHALTTGPDGRYSMDFKWKDSPYEVYIAKNGYSYIRLITNNITDDTLRVNYQNVEFGQHDSRLDFAMNLIDHLMVKVRNTPPAAGDDQVILNIRKTRNGPAHLGPLYDTGIVDHDYYLGLLTPGSYVYLDYSIKQQGITTYHLDSVLIQPNTLLQHEIVF